MEVEASEPGVGNGFRGIGLLQYFISSCTTSINELVMTICEDIKLVLKWNIELP
jgi:hypothetical protein